MNHQNATDEINSFNSDLHCKLSNSKKNIEVINRSVNTKEDSAAYFLRRFPVSKWIHKQVRWTPSTVIIGLLCDHL